MSVNMHFQCNLDTIWTTYTFDANGNQQIIGTPVGAPTTDVRDYENQNTLVQLADGTRVTMAYNADFRRVRKES